MLLIPAVLAGKLMAMPLLAVVACVALMPQQRVEKRREKIKTQKIFCKKSLPKSLSQLIVSNLWPHAANDRSVHGAVHA